MEFPIVDLSVEENEHDHRVTAEEILKAIEPLDSNTLYGHRIAAAQVHALLDLASAIRSLGKWDS